MTVEWAQQGGHKPHPLPQVANSVEWDNWGWEDRANGSLLGSCSQALNEEKEAPTPEPNHSVAV